MDSIAVAGAALALFTWAFTPTFWAKLPALIVLLVAIAFLIFHAELTSRLWLSAKIAVTAVLYILTIAYAYPQLTDQWKSEHPQQSSQHASALTAVPPASQSPASPSQPRQTIDQTSILRRNTNELAKEIVDFAEQREGNLTRLRAELMATAYSSALSRGPELRDLQGRLQDWNRQTSVQFSTLYWPRVEATMNELANAGVDTSFVSRAVATGSPKAIGLRLSVLADRIGRKPPFQREVTPLELRSIAKQTGGIRIQVFAYAKDPNSRKIAEGLENALKDEKKAVDEKVYPLDSAQAEHSGIVVIYPTIGGFSSDTIVPLLSSCELVSTAKYEQIGPVVGKDDVMKFEIWPCDSTCSANFVSEHRGFQQFN